MPEGSCLTSPGQALLEDGLGLSGLQADAAAQRQVLRRWLAQLSAVLPAAPRELPQDDAYITDLFTRAGLRMAAEDDASEPLPASSVKALDALQRDGRFDEASAVGLCALQAWWARRVQREPGDERDRLTDMWLLATARNVARMTLLAASRPAGSDPVDHSPAGYPVLAARFNVTGTTVARVSVDEQGRPVKAEVLERHLHVPGVPGDSQAFSQVMDEATVSAALAAADKPTGQRHTKKVEFVWKLQD